MSKLIAFSDASMTVTEQSNSQGGLTKQERARARAGRLDRVAQRKNTRDVFKIARNFEKNIVSGNSKQKERGLAIEKRIRDRFKARNARQDKRAQRNGGSFL